MSTLELLHDDVMESIVLKSGFGVFDLLVYLGAQYFCKLTKNHLVSPFERNPSGTASHKNLFNIVQACFCVI